MALTQQNRSISIATPLGTDKVVLKSITITEQLGRPFVMKADLLSEDAAIDFLGVIGSGVTVRWRMPDQGGSEKKRFFSGYVSSFVQLSRSEGFYHYEATIVPWLWFLTRSADCRIFHKGMASPPDDMTVPGIIKKIFKDHGFADITDSLTGTYRTLDHCVQYRETDFNFVSRLMEQEGIYYFFEHVDDGGGTIKHKLKLADAMSAHSETTGYETLKYRPASGAGGDSDSGEAKGGISSWSRIKNVRPGSYKVNDFDFKRPKTNMIGGSTQDRNHPNSGFEIYDFAANFADEDSGDHGEAYAKLRMEEAQAQHDIVVGSSDSPGIACGSKFTLDGHPRSDENGDYVVIGVSYQCNAESYTGGNAASSGKIFHCDFTAIPASGVFRPARTTEKPRIQGPQTAIVVGKAGEEILTDEFGRIKVQFHWDRYSPANENTPCWVRVSQTWAGKNWGTVFLPRIGQEVIVEFMDGNPDRPIVTGAVYNGESKPPYTLPDNATKSTIKSNSSKGGQGFNEIRFEDKKGSEQVFMHAEKDQDVRVKNDAKEWIGNDRHLVVKANQRETVEADKHTHVKGEQLLKVDGTYGRNIAKDEIAKIGGNNHLDITGDQVSKIGGNLHAKVTGNHHESATGDIRLTATGGMDIKASQNGAFVSDMNVHVKGGMVVVIEAGMQLSLKAGANMIDIGPSGISIVGTMVNINMGGAAGSGSGAQAASPSSPNAPDAVTDATEASDAEAGSSTTKTAPTPPTASQFSASARALQEASRAGAPGVEPPSSAASNAATAAGTATSAAAAATAAASSASTAAASATSAASAASAAGLTSVAAAATAAGNAASAASAAATDAANQATAAANDAVAAATDAANQAVSDATDTVTSAVAPATEALGQATSAASDAASQASAAQADAAAQVAAANAQAAAANATASAAAANAAATSASAAAAAATTATTAASQAQSAVPSAPSVTNV